MNVERSTVHAYGVLGATETAAEFRPGIAGATVSRVTIGSLGVIVSFLPYSEFCSRIWKQNAENVGWISKIAVKHNQVLKDAITMADVVPLRLPSMYSDLGVLRRVVNNNEQQLQKALALVRDKVEWAVKIYSTRRDDESVGHGQAAHATGKDYLLRRSNEIRAEATIQDGKRRRVDEIYARLDRHCADSIRNSPQAAVLTGIEGPMLLNAAYLIDRAEQAHFLSAVAEVAEAARPSGLVVETTGPWPAYNFTSGMTSYDEDGSDDC